MSYVPTPDTNGSHRLSPALLAPVSASMVSRLARLAGGWVDVMGPPLSKLMRIPVGEEVAGLFMLSRTTSPCPGGMCSFTHALSLTQASG